MAFLGRLNNQGVLINCEIFSGNRPKALESQSPQGNAEEHGTDAQLLGAKSSRTFIKTYDDGKLVPAIGNPRTLRYVDSSLSSCDANFMDETDGSTLCYCSQRTNETETQAICFPQENESASSSNSSQYEEAMPITMEEELMLEKDSTTSMCSSTIDNNPYIPSLKLQSRSDTDSGAYSPTYSQTIKVLKLERPVKEAYDTWLSAKRAQHHYKHEAELQKEEDRLQKAAERQRLAKERYKQWCWQKSQQQSTSKSSMKAAPNGPKNKNNSAAAPRLDAAAQRRLQEWELEKVKQAEKRRQQQQREAQKLHQENLLRLKKADEAFEKWIQNVSQRPKPVPLNQGFKSLRGTISDIYVNPNEWVD
ncbi:GL26646 [Drosophila persimilis]|uniref:GL26646 n=1 Tax=Drosophila persimilis TaxID=7234 RepID=B4GT27_DROPE|nr:coiled-coil domain-containing protein 34 [Drosophila persimilis]EDW25536.1 GL26646 [Drosophila persimilis]